jgi:hypothetical protein
MKLHRSVEENNRDSGNIRRCINLCLTICFNCWGYNYNIYWLILGLFNDISTANLYTYSVEYVVIVNYELLSMWMKSRGLL